MATLESKPPTHLDEALRPCRRCDLAVVARRQASSGVGEVDPVQSVGGFAAELEHDSMFEGNVAEDPQVEIFETGSKQAVAAYVAVRAARADAASHARPVRYVGRRIKPRIRLVSSGRRSANAAAVGVKLGVDAGNSIRALCVGAVKALVGPCSCREHCAAVQNENRRDRPAIEHCLHDVVVAVDVVNVPCAGDRGGVAQVGVHTAVFLLESAADSAQRVIRRREGSAKVAGILRARKSVCIRLEAIDGVAPDIVASEAEASGDLLGRRDLQGFVTACQVRKQIDNSCSKDAAAIVDGGSTSRTSSDAGIELTPVGDAGCGSAWRTEGCRIRRVGWRQ